MNPSFASGNVVAHCPQCGAGVSVVQHEGINPYVLPMSIEPSCAHLERTETQARVIPQYYGERLVGEYHEQKQSRNAEMEAKGEQFAEVFFDWLTDRLREDTRRER